jgi:hypothetical protein
LASWQLDWVLSDDFNPGPTATAKLLESGVALDETAADASNADDLTAATLGPAVVTRVPPKRADTATADDSNDRWRDIREGAPCSVEWSALILNGSSGLDNTTLANVSLTAGES